MTWPVSNSLLSTSGCQPIQVLAPKPGSAREKQQLSLTKDAFSALWDHNWFQQSTDRLHITQKPFKRTEFDSGSSSFYKYPSSSTIYRQHSYLKINGDGRLSWIAWNGFIRKSRRILESVANYLSVCMPVFLGTPEASYLCLPFLLLEWDYVVGNWLVHTFNNLKHVSSSLASPSPHRRTKSSLTYFYHPATLEIFSSAGHSPSLEKYLREAPSTVYPSARNIMFYKLHTMCLLQTTIFHLNAPYHCVAHSWKIHAAQEAPSVNWRKHQTLYPHCH